MYMNKWSAGKNQLKFKLHKFEILKAKCYIFDLHLANKINFRKYNMKTEKIKNERIISKVYFKMFKH